VDTVLPVWRAYRLARTDWPLDEQAYALHALLAGFLDTATRTQVLRGVTVDAPEKVMAAAVTALLGPEEAGPAELHATADLPAHDESRNGITTARSTCANSSETTCPPGTRAAVRSSPTLPRAWGRVSQDTSYRQVGVGAVAEVAYLPSTT
jgi:hypothetical protein